ncbi:MAG: DUF2272 domain-containing protein, partial [Brevundimonas sp.]|nr:DUF2272 domain-containing protein [Brevundimonas sp.]
GVRAALAILLAVVTATPAAAQSARLPRDIFDVIPPSARVEGERGRMRMVQPLCRIGPTHWARRRIVDIAVQEWAVFGYQTIDARPVETRRLPDGVVGDAANPPRSTPRNARHLLRLGTWESDRDADATIAGYWTATPDGPGLLARQNRQWRRGDDGPVDWVQPWSAAFVSWVMCEAGLGDPDQFRRDISHRVYIDQAIRARDGAAPDAAYVAYDAGEQPIEPGDLLCNSRGGVDYRGLADRRPDMGAYAPAHCDIVVRVDADRINVIGGNVVQGVSLTLLPLTSEGSAHPRPLAADDLAGARTVFAHLKLRADPVEPDAMDRSPTIRALAGS